MNEVKNTSITESIMICPLTNRRFKTTTTITVITQTETKVEFLDDGEIQEQQPPKPKATKKVIKKKANTNIKEYLNKEEEPKQEEPKQEEPKPKDTKIGMSKVAELLKFE